MNPAKRYISLAIALIAALSATAYTIEEIPNVHVADKTRYVSNPDGILTKATVDSLDATIGSIWSTSSAEVVAVVVNSIGNDDIDNFATGLFRHWGIGKKDNNNGILILVVKEQRKAVIRSGYGAEGLLPDIICGRIIRNDMAPHFKKGDYDAGMTAAVGTVHRILTTPGAVEELKSKYGNDARSQKSFFPHYVKLSAIISLLMFAYLLFLLVRTWNDDPYDRYKRLSELRLPYAVAAMICLGMGIPALLILIAATKNSRNRKRTCKNCKAKMRKLSEEEDNRFLTPAQDVEERLDSVDYDVWVCDTCGETDIFSFPNKNTPYQECPVCHTKAAMLVGDRLIQRPTPTKEGRGIKSYKCRNCGKTTDLTYVVPADDIPVIVPFIGGFGSGRGGGGFGGGSFGGGMTGGGGASGGW